MNNLPTYLLKHKYNLMVNSINNIKVNQDDQVIQDDKVKQYINVNQVKEANQLNNIDLMNLFIKVNDDNKIYRDDKIRKNNTIDNLIYRVVVICPTYNRRRFMSQLIYQFNYQDYPKKYLQMVILDDSLISNSDIFEDIDDIDLKSRIHYVYDYDKKTIGAKRNILNKIALSLDAEYIVCFDDDDYYPSNRVSAGVKCLSNSGYKIGGTSTLPIYYPNLNEIYVIGPFINKIYRGHATNGTLVYHIDYLKNNSYDDNDTRKEEVKFLRNFNCNLIQIPYTDVMLCISHQTNTVCKTDLIINGKKLDKKLNDIITDYYLYDFFRKI